MKTLVWLAFGLGVSAGCSSSPSEGVSGDASVTDGAAKDAFVTKADAHGGSEGGKDAANDAVAHRDGGDSGSPVMVDSGADAAPDGGVDSARDAGSDAKDAAVDAPVDSGVDAPLVCAAGTAHCVGDPLGVCATMLGTNSNCNSCGDTCALPNSSAQCVAGTPSNTCTLELCNQGWANCDDVTPNGCEVSTANDVNNCDSCGNACPYGPNSTPVCTNSACGIICSSGFADCDGNPTNGCEVDTSVDPANCGTCGGACSTNHATETCGAGVCGIVLCSAGFADCDTKASDGCETNVGTDPNNCGGCGHTCMGAMMCVAGACF